MWAWRVFQAQIYWSIWRVYKDLPQRFAEAEAEPPAPKHITLALTESGEKIGVLQ